VSNDQVLAWKTAWAAAAFPGVCGQCGKKLTEDWASNGLKWLYCIAEGHELRLVGLSCSPVTEWECCFLGPPGLFLWWLRAREWEDRHNPELLHVYGLRWLLYNHSDRSLVSEPTEQWGAEENADAPHFAFVVLPAAEQRHILHAVCLDPQSLWHFEAWRDAFRRDMQATSLEVDEVTRKRMLGRQYAQLPYGERAAFAQAVGYSPRYLRIIAGAKRAQIGTNRHRIG